MNWRRLSYSICVAAVITAISLVKIEGSGEFVLWPGIFVHVMFNGVSLAIPSGDDFYSLPANAFVLFNVAFYTIDDCDRYSSLAHPPSLKSNFLLRCAGPF